MSSKKRPARVQVDPSEFLEEDQPPQSGTVFNIWFNKWSGGGNDFQLVKSKYKVDIDRDSGYTKADNESSQQYFCLFFAKGMCVKGHKCNYLHRIPTDFDVFQQTVDCFGREKFSEYRDDMSGIGSFNHVNKTLYIGGLVIRKDTQQLLDKEFRKFGKISKINVINDKNCGFVSFKNEQNAQFAKEAMMGQSLYGTDILNVKWANEDPNPEAVKEKKRQLELETEQVVKGLLDRYENSKRYKKIVSQHTEQEPEVEEPEEDAIEEKKQEVKQIEPPKQQSSILSNNSSLDYLKLLNKAPAKVYKPVISGYDSDEDSD